jgi:hypothetical protein
VLQGDGGTQANQGSFNPTLIESPTSPYGKFLKVDLTETFESPAGGPADAGVDVVALGLRNPYRGAFDRETGDFYIGDVGFNAVEEVDFIPAGHFTNPAAEILDFGWTDREGTIETDANNAGGPGSPADIDPIFEYAHNGGVNLPHETLFTGGSITGGYVYRGPVEELDGRYFFADFTAQRIYSGEFDTSTDPDDYDGDNFTNIQRHDNDFEDMIEGGANLQFLTSFGEDNAGNLYIVKFGDSFFPDLGEGEIFRIAAPKSFAATVDRQSGEITLTNTTGEAIEIDSLVISSPFGAIDPTLITPITGRHDFSGDRLVDNNDDWTRTGETNEFFSEETTGDAGMIGAGISIDLAEAGGGWRPSPTEDLAIWLFLSDGSLVSADLDFLGLPWARSDLDFDGELTRNDFAILAANNNTDLGGLSGAVAYALGDLNGDGANNFLDFRMFKDDYIDANGIEAFAQLIAGVPEPGSLTLAMAVLAVAAGWRLRDSPHRI